MSQPPKKPSTTEDEYFAREDAEKLRKLAYDRAKATVAVNREELRALHAGHCPFCGMELHAVRFHGAEIKRCFDCGATAFASGELEKLGMAEGQHPGVVASIINIFR